MNIATSQDDSDYVDLIVDSVIDLSEEGHQEVAAIFSYALAICILISLCIKYDLWIRYNKSIETFSNFETLWSTGNWKNLAIEMALLLVSPYRFLTGLRYVEFVEAFDVTIEYEINEVLLAFSFVRIYLIMKMYIYFTELINPRSQRVCQMNGCEANVMFAIKSIIMGQPY